MKQINKDAVVAVLNKIMELELAGVVRYTHYSLMVYGHGRIPIVSWMKDNAAESLLHATKAGELVTLLGGEPSLKIGSLLETHQYDLDGMMRESLAHENAAKDAYYELLAVVEGKSVLLEEYARTMIVEEETHADEVNKMLRQPGQKGVFSE